MGVGDAHSPVRRICSPGSCGWRRPRPESRRRLDARPYRLDLPSTLRWIDVDLPEIISYKEELLADENLSAN